MSGAPVLLHHPSSLAHETGAHPESSGRIVAIEQELRDRDWCGWERVASDPVALETLTAVHPASHVEMVGRAAAAGGARIDADTVVSGGSFVAALHACGGAVELVDRLLARSAPCGFSIHRPPGHHATPSVAMGFCLFNNIAVAARHAVDAHGLERVMIVDWDVHHGNGTNDIFAADPRVLFVSVHQSPLYPGTGAASDAGTGDGKGFTINVPVGPGSGDEVFSSVVRNVAVPLARAWAPQLLLISAGFDAHREDPLAECDVTETGFASMAAALREVCEDVGAPFGAVLEGGYAPGALARSVAATMAAMAGAEVGSAGAEAAGGDVAPEARRARERLARYWPDLG